MDHSLWENLHLKDTWDFQKDLEGISIYCQHEVTGTKFTFPSENKQTENLKKPEYTNETVIFFKTLDSKEWRMLVAKRQETNDMRHRKMLEKNWLF